MRVRQRNRVAIVWIAAHALAACSDAASAGTRDRSQPSSAAGTSDVASGGASGNAGDTSTAGNSGSSAGTGASTTDTGGAMGTAGDNAAPQPDGGAAPGDFTSGLTPPDPSVAFEWTATTPGGGDCSPGRYVGTFTCGYFAMATDPSALVMVTGPISITLAQSQDGEFLEITEGKLEGFAQLIIGFRAELQGRLDCATGRLEATALNGAYGFGDPAIFPIGTFEGTLGGLLDPGTAVLDGDWDLTVTAGGFCRGPWQANWAP